MDAPIESLFQVRLNSGLVVKLFVPPPGPLQGGRPDIHHSDQGVQYAAEAYVKTLHGTGVQISMAAVGEARENGYAERLIRTIKEEEVDLSDYEDYHDAYRQIGQFLDEVYSHKRIHSSLGYLTPVEFESRWLREHRSRGELHKNT